jgi:hypothetical protein
MFCVQIELDKRYKCKFGDALLARSIPMNRVTPTGITLCGVRAAESSLDGRNGEAIDLVTDIRNLRARLNPARLPLNFDR